MLDFDSIVIASPDLVVPVLVVTTLITGAVVWNYVRQTGPSWVRCVAATLKLLAIFLLAFCVLQPMIRAQRPRPRANLLPILIDNSRSMRIRVRADGPTRSERTSDAFDESSAWRIRMAQDLDVRPYRFDARLDPFASVKELKFDGNASTLHASLSSLAERFQGRPVGGVVVVTDGNATDIGNAADWSKLPFPVFPVLPDVDSSPRDLRLVDVGIRQTNFETAPVTVNATGALHGEQQDVMVKLIDLANGEVVGQQNVSVSAGDGNDQADLKARIQFRPQRSGVSFYRMEMESANGGSDWESTLENNRRLITVDRRPGPYRILYLAGRPNWDFKFLRRALQEDVEIQLVGLLRIANKEPKFTFRDSKVNDTNPLFAGLGDEEEEAAEQYDEPVILRLGVKESEELSEGFPETAEELFAYQAVILDDIEPAFFTADQLLLLRRFVAARGGGLLMLGGQEAFSAREFTTTPLGELSPVYGPPRTDRFRSEDDIAEDDRGGARKGRYRLSITREGLLQPWVRLRTDEASEQSRLEKMPTLTTINPVGDVKPGATTMMSLDETSGDGESSQPGLVVQRFGKGRTAAMPIGDTWRLSMRRDQDANDDPAQAWRQIAHWLVGEVPQRVEAVVKESSGPSAPVRIQVTVRDEAFLPLDNAVIEMELTKVDLDGSSVDPADASPGEAESKNESIRLPVTPDESVSGQYNAEYWNREPGAYRVSILAKSADGSEVGTTEAGWTSDLQALEFQNLAIDRQGLERLAEQTGGEVIQMDELDRFANDFPNRKVPITETWVYPLWHQPWVLTLAIACLVGEWTLRRWKGMR
ncbi:MAG: hypothetical protein AAF989_00575 [Planctomycetota bacterium]